MDKSLSLWDATFYKRFAGYSCLQPLWEPAAAEFVNNWPDPDDFNRIAAASGEAPVAFILQAAHMTYEQMIVSRKQVPMRLNLWHDFFNNLTWLAFPHIKWAIIQRYSCENASAQRTPRQNLLAHFDECGMIICSARREYCDLIEQYRWRELFWERPELPHYVEPFIFGHGLFEKCLNPYVGLTGKAIFLSVEENFFARKKRDQLFFIDKAIASFILSDRLPDSPKALHPFPLLGWPGWYPPNRSADFYNNTQYFRPKPVTQKMLDVLVMP